jgi:hypothetical protein
MWTPTTRQQHNRPVARYQTDLTDAEWRVIAPHLPKPSATGRPRAWPMREILNGIFYVMRAGCPWRLLPNDLPPWETIYRWFAVWRDDGRRPENKLGGPRCEPKTAKFIHSTRQGSLRSGPCPARSAVTASGLGGHLGHHLRLLALPLTPPSDRPLKGNRSRREAGMGGGNFHSLRCEGDHQIWQPFFWRIVNCGRAWHNGPHGHKSVVAPARAIVPLLLKKNTS